MPISRVSVCSEIFNASTGTQETNLPTPYPRSNAEASVSIPHARYTIYSSGAFFLHRLAAKKQLNC